MTAAGIPAPAPIARPSMAGGMRAAGRRVAASPYWPKAWIGTVMVLSLVMIRLGELLGPVRYIKPVFSVTAALFALHMFNSKPAAWEAVKKNRQLHLLLAYALCVVASVPMSIWRGKSFGLMQILPWAIAMVVIVTLTTPQLPVFDRVIRWLGWIAALAGVLIVVQGAVVEGSRVTTGGSYDSNDLGGLFAMMLPLALGSSLRGKGWERMFSMGAAFIILATLMRTGSRGGLLALVAGSVVFLLAFRPQKAIMAIGVVGVLSPFGWKFAPPVMRERAATLFALEDDYNTTSSSGRVYLWKRGIKFTLANPLVGIGAGTFEDQVGRDFAEQGTRGAWHTAHNTYVQIFAELGLIGGCVLIALLVRAVKNAFYFYSWKSRVHRPELLASIMAYLVAITFLSHGYSYLMFGLIAISAFTEQVLQRVRAAPPAQPQVAAGPRRRSLAPMRPVASAAAMRPR